MLVHPLAAIGSADRGFVARRDYHAAAKPCAPHWSHIRHGTLGSIADPAVTLVMRHNGL